MFAQKSPRALLDDADYYYDVEKYSQALEKYLAFDQDKGNDLDVKTRIGACYYYVGNTSEGLRFLNYVVQNSKNPLPVTYLFMGKCYQADFLYKDAIKYYKEYLRQLKSSSPERASVKDDIRRCAVGLHTKDLGDKVFVQNFGEKVNTSGHDFAPILSPNDEDRLYFASCREGNLGGLRNGEGLKDERGGTYSSDMYSTSVENGEWGDVQAMSYLLNSPRYDMVLGFTEGGKSLYYFKGFSLDEGEIMVDTFKTDGNKSLFSTAFNSPMIAENGDGTPFFFHDTLMFFSSRRDGGFGGSDLYYAKKSDGRWLAPINMGAQINTGFDETMPFLAADGRTLYFSSNNLKSIGGFDVFKTRFIDSDFTWTEPKNLGIPINSAGDDEHFILNSDGSKGYFCSNRKDGFGGKDLYSIVFRVALPEQINTSTPSDFTAVRPMLKKEDSPESAVVNAQDEVINLLIAPLLFERDDNLMTPSNIRILDPIVVAMKRYPKIKIMLTSHCEENGNTEFDLYLSVKRIEKISEYLIKNGVSPSNIGLQGCGAAYPIAMNMMDGKANISGQKLNRRVELKLFKTEKLPITIKEERPVVSEFMAAKEAQQYEDATKGLSYRVQIASIKQMYSGEITKLYPDVLIERFPDKGLYQYTIGLFKSYSSAEQLKKELDARGVLNATVIPYINGFRINEEEYKTFSGLYIDLQTYLKKTKKG